MGLDLIIDNLHGCLYLSTELPFSKEVEDQLLEHDCMLQVPGGYFFLSHQAPKNLFFDRCSWDCLKFSEDQVVMQDAVNQGRMTPEFKHKYQNDIESQLIAIKPVVSVQSHTQMVTETIEHIISTCRLVGVEIEELRTLLTGRNVITGEWIHIHYWY